LGCLSLATAVPADQAVYATNAQAIVSRGYLARFAD
jgi:hypothetical protein